MIKKKKIKRSSLIARLDRLAREKTRKRDGCCKKCGQVGFEVHHIRKRKYYSTRWNRNNLLYLCRDCHDLTESNALGFHKWFCHRFPDRAEAIQELAMVKLDTWRDTDLLEVENALKEIDWE